MQVLRFLFSPNGRIAPQPFVFSAVALYLFGLASHSLTRPDIMAREGLWPFMAVQAVLIWIWLVLHTKRLRDAGSAGGIAVGASVLYALSIVLLSIMGVGFSNSAGGPMSNPNAGAALNLILMLYVILTLLRSSQSGPALIVIAALTILAFVPIIVAVAVTIWAATRRRIART